MPNKAWSGKASRPILLSPSTLHQVTIIKKGPYRAFFNKGGSLKVISTGKRNCD
jgi:hypothetical protein